jgi:hypothetical protein
MNLILEQCPPELTDLQTHFIWVIRRSMKWKSVEKLVPGIPELSQCAATYVPHEIQQLFTCSQLHNLPTATFHKQIPLSHGILKTQSTSKMDSKIFYMCGGQRCAGSVDVLLQHPGSQTMYAVVNEFELLWDEDLHIDPYQDYCKHITGRLYYSDRSVDVVISMDNILRHTICSIFKHSSGIFLHLLPT